MRHINIITALFRAKRPTQTVFTLNEMRQLLPLSSSQLDDALYYAAKKNGIIRITQGIYTLTKDYSHKEFANKFRTPSYIGLYTILQKEGIVFQPYTSLFAVTNRTEKVTIGDQTYIYRKIKDDCLLNPMGIKLEDEVYIATPERALCDILYLDGSTHFDNVRSINWDLMKALNDTVYNNKSITQLIHNYSSP